MISVAGSSKSSSEYNRSTTIGLFWHLVLQLLVSAYEVRKYMCTSFTIAMYFVWLCFNYVANSLTLANVNWGRGFSFLSFSLRSCCVHGRMLHTGFGSRSSSSTALSNCRHLFLSPIQTSWNSLPHQLRQFWQSLENYLQRTYLRVIKYTQKRNRDALWFGAIKFRDWCCQWQFTVCFVWAILYAEWMRESDNDNGKQ